MRYYTHSGSTWQDIVIWIKRRFSSEIQKCGKETNHARVEGSHFCKCTFTMYR